MIDIKEKKYCCGCEACKNICVQNCIEMEYDKEGFLYPKINEEICINCGLCNKVCPIENNKLFRNKFIEVFAGINKNENIRRESTSGGIFTALCDKFIKNNGVVFGVAFNNENVVIHKKVESIEGLKDLRGAKYVQSRIENTFIEAKQLLDEGKEVLFSGTPCQIAGLYGYLRRDYKNLLTVSIVCHGVPSPIVFDNYIKNIEKKYKKSIRNIYFRSKDDGSWKESRFKIIFSDGSKFSIGIGKDLYTNSFLNDLISRPSCYECKFKKDTFVGDFMIGDFWGIGDKRPDLDDDIGTSLILVNSQKAKKLINDIDSVYLQKMNYEDALRGNPNLEISAIENKNRTKFMDDFSNGVLFDKISKKYMKPLIITRKKRIKNKIKRMLKIK